MIAGIAGAVIAVVLLGVGAVVVVVIVLKSKAKNEPHNENVRASTFAVEIDGGSIGGRTSTTTVIHESFEFNL